MTWISMLSDWRGRTDPAVVTTDGSWSGDELLARAAGAAEWLDVIGATAGHTVSALLRAGPEAFALMIAGASSDRPIAPLGPRHTATELAACVASLGADLLIVDEAFIDVAAQVAQRLPVRVVPLVNVRPSTRGLELSVPDRAIAFVLHTSGTSGQPKAVPYRQNRLRRRTSINAELAELGPGRVFASASPFHHIAGWGNYAVALAAGAAVVPVAAFTVEAWKELARVGTTNALVVPTMIDMLLEAGVLGVGALRYLHYGASPIHPATLARVQSTLPDVALLNIFGQTEGSPITALTPADHRRAADGRPDLLRSVGRPAPATEVRIEGAAPDGTGEVCARGGHLMRPDADGWLRTGDLGRLDDEGYLFLVDRKNDKIVRGGENVYPQEVERILVTHPGVRECAVVGVPDVRWGQVVKAFVVVSEPDGSVDFDELRRHVRTELAGFKVPTEWELIPNLPRNAAGKVVRRALVQPGN